MSGRVLLHVGLPKSGTTYLQQRLWESRDRLRERGVVLPGDRAEDHFAGAVELRGTHERWGLDPVATAGSWALLAGEAAAAAAHDRTAVISHEILGACTAEQAERALVPLERVEVHVVATARDLGRQALADWQERLKNGGTERFEAFEETVVATADETVDGGERTLAFWRAQDLADVLARWEGSVPPERIHVVVGPWPGAATGALWASFADLLGVDPGAVPAPEGPANPSLGRAEADLLRAVNEALGGRIGQPAYGQVVKHWWAEQVLAPRTSARLALTPGLHAALLAVAERTNEAVRRRGYAVHGDLADLLPDPPAPDAPDAPDAEEASRAAVATEPDPAEVAEAVAMLLDAVEQVHGAERQSRRRGIFRRR